MRLPHRLPTALALISAMASPAAFGQTFNAPGNILISDQFNNRVIEVDAFKNIVFSFGSNNPTLCNPGPGAIIAPTMWSGWRKA